MRPTPFLARLFAVLAVLALAACTNAPLDVAPNVDLSKFQGKWYEIARLPRTTQTNCYGTTAFYSAPSSGSAMQFINQCNVGSNEGTLNTVSMSATVPDPSTPAKLALDIGGYSGDYWILEVGPQYEYAVVGHPSRLYLWILSRTPTLDTTTTQTLIAHAQSEQFDTSQLIYTPQPPTGERVSSAGPVGPIPPALTTGCAASAPGHARSRGAAWALLLVTALGLLGRYTRGRRRMLQTR
jgi:apolipoprotein D and lipocalin family protein